MQPTYNCYLSLQHFVNALLHASMILNVTEIKAMLLTLNNEMVQEQQIPQKNFARR